MVKSIIVMVKFIRKFLTPKVEFHKRFIYFKGKIQRLETIVVNVLYVIMKGQCDFLTLHSGCCGRGLKCRDGHFVSWFILSSRVYPKTWNRVNRH